MDCNSFELDCFGHRIVLVLCGKIEGGIKTTGIFDSREEREERIEKEKLEFEKKIEAKRKLISEMDKIKVSTTDIRKNYEVIGPVHFNIINNSVLANPMSNLFSSYEKSRPEIADASVKASTLNGWSSIYGRMCHDLSDYDKAFYVCVQELKKRAFLLGANAVIGMSYKMEFYADSSSYSYMQMCGTAIRITEDDLFE